MPQPANQLGGTALMCHQDTSQAAVMVVELEHLFNGWKTHSTERSV